MNSWPFAELKRLVEYKAAWEGVPVLTLSVKQTRGTTISCYRCGERLQDGGRDRPRQLWCQQCKKWYERDMVAVINISRRGRLRFDRSKGGAGEAMMQERECRDPLLLRVDASKLSLGRGVLETLVRNTQR